jgi:hypothetical protein
MAKRKIDTGLWPKRWFRELSPVEKVGWFYLLTNCDGVGVWDADLKLADFCIGSPVNWEALRVAAKDNIEVLENGKWWIVDFCLFQYGEIPENPESAAHKNIKGMLVKHGLWERYRSLLPDSRADSGGESGLNQGVIEAKAKAKEKAKEKESYADGVLLKPVEHAKLVAQYGEVNTRRAITKLSAYKLAKGKHYRSDYGAILNWVMREVMGKGAVPEPTKDTKCPECGRSAPDHNPDCSKYVDKHDGGDQG